MGAVVPTASISSHVLDTVPGDPAAGVALIAYILQNDEWKQIGETFTGQDGRVPWVSPNFALIKGTYKLWFGIGDYYKSQDTESFYPYAEVVFKVNDASRHYHVPLTLSPYAYSTYRGS
ncbi:unnamed protein product [Heligmosomoides polygyrus]|uniref:5-hydroxyisourate hydrolase n=1 Tax=Heligmosomoides polygyrus TaxID=6339 RepID=A0A183FG59_HELPZ|nr:unnamed protein product [Heligmosomoides polygyrus]